MYITNIEGNKILELKEKFHSAPLFPHLVLDNFFPLEIIEGVIGEIKSNTTLNKSNDYIFAKNKFENPSLEMLGSNGKLIKEYLTSVSFKNFLSEIYGQEIFIDSEFSGGGVHRGGANSFLDMHADFELHPGNAKWKRELNILLYLNKEWKPNYGGCLDLKNSKTGETASIEPYLNRMVIMLTKEHTLHGYKPISFPPGEFRTSIAAYAYSIASKDENNKLRSTTLWVPEKKGLAKKIVAILTPSLVMLKQKLFGSSTAKRK